MWNSVKPSHGSYRIAIIIITLTTFWLSVPFHSNAQSQASESQASSDEPSEADRSSSAPNYVEPIERELKGGESHSYEIALTKNQSQLNCRPTRHRCGGANDSALTASS